MTTETIQINDFEKAVNETKQDITKVDELNAPKKRGRKSKSEMTSLPNVAPKPTAQDYEAPLKSLFLFSGVLLSTGLKFKGFELTEEEATLLAKQGSEVAIEFAPMMNSKYVKLGAFTVAMASVYGIKAYSYTNHLNMLEEEKKVRENISHEVQQNR